MPYDVNIPAALSSSNDSGGSLFSEFSLGTISGSFEKFYASGAIDIPASTKITLWDVADAMSVSADFVAAVVANRSESQYLWVFRYTDPGGDEASWAERVPPGGFTVIWGDTLNSLFAGEVASITGQDLPNDTVAKIEAFNPSGGIGQAELILFAEQI